MLRNLALLVFPVALLIGCSNNTKPTKAPLPNSHGKQIIVKQARIDIPLTDSAKLIKHLDSLPKAVFPLSAPNGNDNPNINLAEFKNKSLFKLMYKRIPRSIGGAGIDMSDQVDTTFNLCDTNYKSNWLLVTKTPRFFVVEIVGNYLFLVTMDYHLNLIEAISIMSGDPSSNEHYHGELTSTIYKNLIIVMHYNYAQQAGKEDGYRTENEIDEDDIWRIDKTGHFKAIRYSQHGNSDF